mmetsp:Transcript_135345/g.201296  ORF Transcript_135345/g.201296 Transcript_135345/m.201296 type:complete len:238 (-) Transcript_135345:88-801(-)
MISANALDVMKFTTTHKPKTMSQTSLGKKKKSFLNKFLTKTYHMIDKCDPSIASWSCGGESFTVFDVDAFEKTVLPSYFNHSKFSSFIRQLNFYGFQKLRSDPDLQVHTTAVRFSHEYFRKGEPDMLHRITRATAGAKQVEGVQVDQVESLQQQVATLQEQVKGLESQMDDRVGEAVRVLNDNYVARVKSLEATYDAALKNILQNYNQQLQASSLLSAHSWSSKPRLAEFIRSNHAV